MVTRKLYIEILETSIINELTDILNSFHTLIVLLIHLFDANNLKMTPHMRRQRKHLKQIYGTEHDLPDSADIRERQNTNKYVFNNRKQIIKTLFKLDYIFFLNNISLNINDIGCNVKV